MIDTSKNKMETCRHNTHTNEKHVIIMIMSLFITQVQKHSKYKHGTSKLTHIHKQTHLTIVIHLYISNENNTYNLDIHIK